MSAQEQYVDVPEAGRVLGVSESTVWRMIRRGALPSIRKGGRRLVPRRALEKSVRQAPADQIPPLTEDHPIFRLVGAGRGGGHAPGARDKHFLLEQ
jgi:excisionase family DNA binding protein